MSERALEVLASRFGSAILETHSQCGDDTALVHPEHWKAIAEFCRTSPDLDFDMLVDLCGVDYPEQSPRIEIVMHLYSLAKGHRLRLKARVGTPDLEMEETAEIESVTSVWPGANWLERETFDLLGVNFRGHPDMRRILMYPEFKGHPLRKDYPANKTQPLVAYRTEEEAGVPLGKQAPFRDDEGMSFGRKVWTRDEAN